MPPNTLGDYVRRGISNAENAVRIARALRISLDWLMTGRGLAGDAAGVAEDTIGVPALGLAVAAGAGAASDDPGVQFDWSFPAGWVRASFGSNAELRMVRVVGDSQHPDLEPGDWIMIDENRRDLRDGMHVVRLDDGLMIKRVQVLPREIRLLSANKSYETIVLDRAELAEAERDFAVIGRMVWKSEVQAGL